MIARLDGFEPYVVWMRAVARRFPGPPEVTALADVDLAVRAGEYVAVMGPSGSGKSTLLNIIGLLDRASEGTFVLNGVDVSLLKNGQLTSLRRDSIGFVFQDFYLMNGRTAQENVALGLVYAGYSGKMRRAVASAVLETVGLGHRISALPATMSGGERQRVAIARALINEPSLLLCDEPTGNLDSGTSAQIMGILDSLHARGVSVVTITHDPIVAAGAERTIMITDGRTVASGIVDPQVENPVDHVGSSPGQSETLFTGQEAAVEHGVTTHNGTLSMPTATDALNPLITAPWRASAPSLLRGETPRRHRVWAAVVGEAIAGLTQKVSRTVLTMVGTAIGAGAIVAILGLTATAAGQIDESFDALQATQVVVNDGGSLSPGGFVDSFPVDAVPRVSRLNGVESCGLVALAPSGSGMVAIPATLATTQLSLPIYGATAGYFASVGASWGLGGTYTQFEEDQGLPVVVVGSEAARRIGGVRVGSVIFIDGFEYEVVGVLSDVDSHPEALTSVYMPWSTLRERYGPPTDTTRATMVIRTRLGAAKQVASEVAIALRPDNPGLLAVVPPPDPPRMRSVISESMGMLFIVLAGVTLLIGTAAIANTTLVAIMERTGEIGLRRAIGASPRHIIAQFLLETVMLGFLAGLIGTSLGVIGVLIAAMFLQWTAVISPWVIGLGPIIGAVGGLLAGLLPAWKAGRVAPILALRR